MDWNRVPVVKAVNRFLKRIKYVMYRVFVRLPLFMLGYKWCISCNKKVSPKEPIVTKVLPTMGGDVYYHCCKKCAEKNGLQAV